MSRTEENMWAIIDQYKEKLNLATTHEQRLKVKYAKVSVLQAERGKGDDCLIHPGASHDVEACSVAEDLL